MSEENVPPPNEQPVTLESSDPAPSAPIALGDQEEPISLVETEEGGGTSKVKMLGAAAIAVDTKADFKRSLNLTGAGATRMRIFRSKLSVPSLDAMQDHINVWLDSQEIEAKHVASVIGTIQGKAPEPNLIVTVWY